MTTRALGTALILFALLATIGGFVSIAASGPTTVWLLVVFVLLIPGLWLVFRTKNER